MPLPQGAGRPADSIGDYVRTLQLRIQAVENELALLFPNSNEDLVVTGDANASTLTLNDTLSVPNPSAGKVTFYQDGTEFRSRNPVGTIQTFLTTGGSSFVVQSDGTASVAGHLPKYVDTTGQLVTDSGLDEPTLVAQSLDNAGVLDQVYSVAPAGQRDLWQYGTVLGSILHYDSTLDILHVTNPIANTMNYSANGGVLFAPVVFNIAPADHVVFGNSTTASVGLSALAGDPVYTGVDGINYTAGGASAFGVRSRNIVRFNSLFIAGTDTGGTQWIATSPTGAAWTLRTTPNFGVLNNFLEFAANSTICVVTVDSTLIFTAWSTNGTTWTAGTGITGPASGVVWSEEKKMFFAQRRDTGEGFTSEDGKTWTSVGAVSTAGAVATIWVPDNDYNRFYIANRDVDGNYSLYSTLDAAVQFQGTHLDGARLDSTGLEGLVYLPLYDRFIIGTNTTGMAYSTARPLDLKVLSDDIRVRGSPLVTSNYSTYGNVDVNNTLVETNISTTVSSIGSLVYQAAQPVGMTIKTNLNGLATSAAGDTLTIRFKINGVTVLTHALIIPAVSVNLPVNISTSMVVQAATVQINSIELVSVLPTMLAANAAYDPTIANTLSITAQWGANVNQLAQTHLDVSTLFINGA